MDKEEADKEEADKEETNKGETRLAGFPLLQSRFPPVSKGLLP